MSMRLHIGIDRAFTSQPYRSPLQLAVHTHRSTHLNWKALPWSECWLHQQGWWSHHGSLHHAERGVTWKDHVKADILQIWVYNHWVHWAWSDCLRCNTHTAVLWSLLRHTKYTVCPHSSSVPHVFMTWHLQHHMSAWHREVRLALKLVCTLTKIS